MLVKSAPAVLVTGATGFIGRHVVRRLMLARRRVVIVARHRGGLTGVERVAKMLDDLPRRSFDVVEGDLAHPDPIATQFRRLESTIDTVIHCAGETSFLCGDRESVRTAQIAGPLALVEMLRPEGLRRWVHLSTAFVCGRREGTIYENETDVGQEFHNGYERLKLELEIRLKYSCAQLGVDLRILRPSIVVGGAPMTPGGLPSNLLVAFLRLLIALSRSTRTRQTPVRIQGRPQARFNIVPVEYVAAAIERLSDEPEAAGETIHLVVDHPPTQSQVLEMISARLGLGNLYLVDVPEALRNPSPLETRVARMLSPYRDYLQQDVHFDDSAARRLLAHHPVSSPVIDGKALERFVELAVFSQRKSVPSGDVIETKRWISQALA